MPAARNSQNVAIWTLALLVVVLCCARFAEAAAGASPAPDEIPRVIARLAPQHCNPTTHKGSTALSAATVASIKALAAATGLTHAGELPVACWHVFGPAATLAATQAAVKVLTEPSVSVMSTSAGAGAAAAGADVGQLFADAALEKTRKLPYYTSSTQQQQQQRRLRRQVIDNSSTAWQYLPPECDAATNTCSNWGLTHSKAIELWQDLGTQLFPLPNISRMGMVIDTGVELRQFNVIPQLAANQSITISRDGNVPADGGVGMGHGTHVFGIMAAGHGPFRQQDDPSGTAGVLGPAAQCVAACNCFGRYTEARDGDVVACIAHAMATGTHWVINLSLGDEGTRNDTAHKLYHDAMAEFCAADGIAVIAAGNGVCVGSGCKLGQLGPKTYVGVDMSNAGLQFDGVTVKPNIASYPAVMAEYFPDCVIAVANTNSAGQLIFGSNFGAAVRIAAPGTDIVSAWPVFGSGNTWQTMSLTGTSMSTPHVAGAALLLRNAFPAANNTQVVRCLVSGSSQKPQFPDAERFLGGGMLNVRAAYDCLAVAMRQEAPFNCRTQVEVPPCVEASSGVRDDGCAEPYFCQTFNRNGSVIQPPSNSSTGSNSSESSNSTVNSSRTQQDSTSTTCDAAAVCGPNTACNVTEQGNFCSCLPGYNPPVFGSIDGQGCISPGNTTGNCTRCPADTCGPNSSCNITDTGPVCSCLPGYSPPVNGTIQELGCFEATGNNTDPKPPTTQAITCRYTYRAAKSNCSLEDGALGACSGNTSACNALVIPQPQFCRRPQLLLNGTQFLVTAAQNCSARVPIGNTCNATCIPGWQGQGYRVTCLPDGSWSPPLGGGCSKLPVDTTVCGACRVGKVCGDAEGCQCVKKGGNSSRCQCATNLGFMEMSAVQGGVLTSRCIWDVEFPWMAASAASNSSSTTYYLIAAINRTVTLPFTVVSTNSSIGRRVTQRQICPAARVVSSEQWLGKELPRCPTGPNTKGIRLATTALKPGEVCNRSLGRGFYYFDTSKRTAAKRGSCFLLRINTTDGMSYVVHVLLA